MARIRLGIRGKVLLTLTFMGVLPLLAMLGAAVYQWSSWRQQIAGQAIMSLTSAEARVLAVTLVRDVQGIQSTVNATPIVDTLSQEIAQVPAAQREQIERQWLTMSRSDPPMREILGNPISADLRNYTQKHPQILQMFVTDHFGQVAASTSRTEDFYQADEDWWTDTYNGGSGRIVVTDAAYDSATGAYVFSICQPIFSGEIVVGVAKVKISVEQWVKGSGGVVSGSRALPMLVRRDGLIVFREGIEPLTQHVPQFYGPIASGGVSDWRSTDTEIQGFGPIILQENIGGIPAKVPAWSLVMYIDKAMVMGPVHRFAIYSLVGGLAIIAAIFFGGVAVVNRTIVKRLQRLQAATHRVAGGDLAGRADILQTERLFAPDEVEILSRDFNDMVSRVQRSHQELMAANELKSNFINIASHELRTPVSYILGMAKLLKDNRDVDRLTYAMQSISARAKRIDDIIHAMFKLMPTQIHEHPLTYEDVKVSELLEAIYLSVFPFVEQRKQRLVIESDPELPVIRVDREKIQDVIENLLVNAIKFTPDEGIIHLSIARHMGESMAIAVSDQGPGISEKELPHIFQPFYTGEEVFKHSTGEVGYQKRGIGLGLAIVRYFVELHGGTINVSSGPTGSTFTVILPISPRPELGGR